MCRQAGVHLRCPPLRPPTLRPPTPTLAPESLWNECATEQAVELPFRTSILTPLPVTLLPIRLLYSVEYLQRECAAKRVFVLPAFETPHNPDAAAAHELAAQAVTTDKKGLRALVDKRLVHQVGLRGLGCVFAKGFIWGAVGFIFGCCVVSFCKWFHFRVLCWCRACAVGSGGCW